MFIFNKMDNVNNKAEVMLKEMRFEYNWRIRAAHNMMSQADKIKRPENAYTKLALLDQSSKLIREAMEINECYYKLKYVMEALR